MFRVQHLPTRLVQLLKLKHRDLLCRLQVSTTWHPVRLFLRGRGMCKQNPSVHGAEVFRQTKDALCLEPLSESRLRILDQMSFEVSLEHIQNCQRSCHLWSQTADNHIFIGHQVSSICLLCLSKFVTFFTTKLLFT